MQCVKGTNSSSEALAEQVDRSPATTEYLRRVTEDRRSMGCARTHRKPRRSHRSLQKRWYVGARDACSPRVSDSSANGVQLEMLRSRYSGSEHAPDGVIDSGSASARVVRTSFCSPLVLDSSVRGSVTTQLGSMGEPWRRRADSNRRIAVLQTAALDHLATPPTSLQA